jgi:hypothetical protein
LSEFFFSKVFQCGETFEHISHTITDNKSY